MSVYKSNYDNHYKNTAQKSGQPKIREQQFPDTIRNLFKKQKTNNNKTLSHPLTCFITFSPSKDGE